MSAPELAPGEVIDGKYVLCRLVGEGAFGLVFEAEDLHMRRRVALKLVFGQRNPHHAKLLRSEVELIRSIEHANVVRLYDFGEHSDGVLYMCMEFVEGRDLGDLLFEEGSLSEQRTLNITLQVLDALIETQRQGIVHLDLKPQNVVLTCEGARRDVVKLVDFGIARTIAGGGSSSGLARGTPLYMAPEQIRNEALGPYTDVYALGLVVYEMLAGVPAFAGNNALDILAKKATSSVRLPDGLATPGVTAVVNRALERDFDKRFPDAAAMYGALRDACDSIAMAGSATGPPGELWARHGTGTNNFSSLRQHTGRLPRPLEDGTETGADNLATGETPRPPRRQTMEMSARQLSEIRVAPTDGGPVDEEAPTQEKLPLIAVRRPTRRRAAGDAASRHSAPLGLKRDDGHPGTDD